MEVYVERAIFQLPKVLRPLFVALALLMTSQLEAAILQLRWQNTSTDHTGITIERQNGTSYVQIASVAPATQSYSDSGLSDGTTYCYRVRAVNAARHELVRNLGGEDVSYLLAP